jgi:hypothetical protein
MTSLAEYPTSKFTKIIYMGDSGTGKTGSLVSLVGAGYKLRILDLDNNLGPLKAFIKKECPERINQVDAISVRDEYIMTTQGAVIDPAQKTKAFVEAMKYLTKWDDGSDPGEWGEETILVIDSLTRLGDYAYEFAKGMNPSSKDPRQWYNAAQVGLESMVATLTGPKFHANVIIITHITWKELQDGTTKGWPSSIGKALGPTLPSYFGTMVLAETSGFGSNVKRKIKTVPTGMIDLKSPAPFALAPDLDLGTGLATLFKTIKEN